MVRRPVASSIKLGTATRIAPRAAVLSIATRASQRLAPGTIRPTRTTPSTAANQDDRVSVRIRPAVLAGMVMSTRARHPALRVRIHSRAAANAHKANAIPLASLERKGPTARGSFLAMGLLAR